MHWTRFLNNIRLICRIANFQTLVRDLRLFVILKTFLRLLYIACHDHNLFTSDLKTPSKNLKIPVFLFYFAKIKISEPRQKR